MTEATVLSDIPALQLFDELAARHGHFCPMSTLGLRLGWAVRRRLKGEPQTVVYKNQTCAVDGIRLALGTESLSVEKQGQHLLLVADSDLSLQLELSPAAMDLAASYRFLASDSERKELLDSLRSADESFLLEIVQARVSP